jgi:hypothetical protein
MLHDCSMAHVWAFARIDGQRFSFSPSSTSRRMARRNSTLFFDRLFGLLDCFHAANHERCKIALHNFFFACFFAAEHLPRNFSLSLLRSLFILWTYSGDRAVEWKNETAKKH